MSTDDIEEFILDNIEVYKKDDDVDMHVRCPKCRECLEIDVTVSRDRIDEYARTEDHCPFCNLCLADKGHAYRVKHMTRCVNDRNRYVHAVPGRKGSKERV